MRLERAFVPRDAGAAGGGEGEEPFWGAGAARSWRRPVAMSGWVL